MFTRITLPLAGTLCAVALTAQAAPTVNVNGPGGNIGSVSSGTLTLIVSSTAAIAGYGTSTMSASLAQTPPARAQITSDASVFTIGPMVYTPSANGWLVPVTATGGTLGQAQAIKYGVSFGPMNNLGTGVYAGAMRESPWKIREGWLPKFSTLAEYLGLLIVLIVLGAIAWVLWEQRKKKV